MSRAQLAGFTLVETVIALTLGAAVVGLVLDLLRSQQRLARVAGAEVEVQLTLHSALTFLVREFRPLGAGGGGSDLFALGATEVTYRAYPRLRTGLRGHPGRLPGSPRRSVRHPATGARERFAARLPGRRHRGGG